MLRRGAVLALVLLGAGGGVRALAGQVVRAARPPAGLSAGSGGAAVLRHEPIFGVGPHTTWRGGWGVEVELESEGGERTLPVEVMYGLTEELTVTAVLPFARPAAGGNLGSVGLRAKWRFATHFAPGRSDALALLGGLTLPRATAVAAPRGGPVLMAGLAAGRESRRWYYFAGVRLLARTARAGRDPGDRAILNVAWGVRPWRTRYRAPDLVLLVEANGRSQGRTRLAGTPVPGTGGRVLSLAPAFLLSVRNVMLKGGLDIPVLERLDDPSRTAETRIVAALEVHW